MRRLSAFLSAIAGAIGTTNLPDPAPSETGVTTHAGNADEFLRTLLSAEYGYHNHKEQMAYAIGALYLAAAGYVIATPTLPLAGASPWKQALFLIMAVVLGAAGLMFVRWQLAMRREALLCITATLRVLGRWLTTAPGSDELQPEPCHPYGWPKVLCVEIERARTENVRLRLAEWIPFLVLVLVGLAALTRIVEGSAELGACLGRVRS